VVATVGFRGVRSVPERSTVDDREEVVLEHGSPPEWDRMGRPGEWPSANRGTVVSLSRPDWAYGQEIDDNLDGSWKPWYNEPERMDRESSFSRHVEDFLES
jgi:hypothetical protein